MEDYIFVCYDLVAKRVFDVYRFATSQLCIRTILPPLYKQGYDAMRDMELRKVASINVETAAVTPLENYEVIDWHEYKFPNTTADVGKKEEEK